jgi:hydroxymethylglutaryl-CoA lyase
MQGLPRQVRIVEVGPRDGLQNEGVPLDIGQRLALIDRLADAGLTTIESGAFVSPRKVPNMAGSGELMQRLERRPGVSYPFLVPNATGLDAALDAGCEDIALFAAASETFSQRNTACSISESMARLAAAAERALAAGLRVRGYLSCVMGCPYEGRCRAVRRGCHGGRPSGHGLLRGQPGRYDRCRQPAPGAGLIEHVAHRYRPSGSPGIFTTPGAWAWRTSMPRCCRA